MDRALAEVPARAPVAILIHGYKFDPRRPASDPHRLVFAATPETRCWKMVSWPVGLGFGRAASGLCIGFGWPGREGHAASMLRTGRTGFAQVYARAERYGARLADLIERLARLSPGRPVDLVAHSLGARVALSALPHLAVAPDRVILLGAAEFDARAVEFLGRLRAPSPKIYNVTARANDAYDLMFERFAPRREGRERALGLGLRERLPDWLDLQIDRADVAEWANDRGIPLERPRARFCHWGFYTRPGAFEFYRAILDRRPGWEIARLREHACFGAQEPRWSRMLARTRRWPGPAQPALALDAGLESALS